MSKNKKQSLQSAHQKPLLKRMWEHKVLYLMILPCLLFFLIFNYIPMTSLVLAFKDFRFDTGIIGGDWKGLYYFKRFFSDPRCIQIIMNTLIISGMKLILALPFPIILAIMFNEIKDSKLGKIRGLFQGVLYIPHFLSWVVVIGIFKKLLAPDDGLMNQLIHQGWDSIIYFAAIMSINPEIYESAAIDGANRFKQIIHITLPMLTPTIVILFIISLGDILKAGFDQIYLLKTPGNANVSEILDTFVIRTGIEQGDFSYAIAISLLQGVIGLIAVVIINKFADKKLDTSLY